MRPGTALDGDQGVLGKGLVLSDVLATPRVAVLSSWRHGHGAGTWHRTDRLNCLNFVFFARRPVCDPGLLRAVVVVVVVVALLAPPSAATTWNVTTPTMAAISAALGSAANNDLVQLLGLTYTGCSSTPVTVPADRNITIRGQGIGVTTVDCGDAGRAFRIS